MTELWYPGAYAVNIGGNGNEMTVSIDIEAARRPDALSLPCEGFGLPPLESMTYGCPVINSDIPALREVSQDAALYVDPYNVEDITEKIEQLLVDEPLRKELQEKGLLQIKKYSWDKSAKQVYELAQLFM